MILRAFVEPIPEDNSGRVRHPVREASAEGATYEEAVAAVRAQLAEGERIIALRVDKN